MFDEVFFFVWVGGEVQCLCCVCVGYMYFELVEKGVNDCVSVKFDVVFFCGDVLCVECKLWCVGVIFEEGQMLCMFGELNFYLLYGWLQFLVCDIDVVLVVGVFVQWCQEMFVWFKENDFFGCNVVFELYEVLLCVGFVMFEGSVVYWDFMVVFEVSGYVFEIIFVYVLVQGGVVEVEVVVVVYVLFLLDGFFDVIVVVCGGGVKFDLVVFDGCDLVVVIVWSWLLVFIGFGYEIDCMIVDEVVNVCCMMLMVVVEYLVQCVVVVDQCCVDLLQRFVCQVECLFDGVCLVFDLVCQLL